MRNFFLIILVFLLLSCCFTPALSHVSYIVRSDYSIEKPFYVWKMVEKSKAFYAWLEQTDDDFSLDIDVYKITVGSRPVNIYLELIVPDVNGYYDDFVPWYAVLGPGLPEITHEVPFDIPKGYGGIIQENVPPGTTRESFYEPFGGKSYFKGPILDYNATVPGTYYIYCWDPYEQGGDYVLVIGKGEFFGPIDIIRAIINTPYIRQNKELHLPMQFL